MPNTPKKGSLEYTLSRLKLLPSEKVHPHEAVKLPEVFSIMDGSVKNFSLFLAVPFDY